MELDFAAVHVEGPDVLAYFHYKVARIGDPCHTEKQLTSTSTMASIFFAYRGLYQQLYLLFYRVSNSEDNESSLAFGQLYREIHKNEERLPSVI